MSVTVKFDPAVLSPQAQIIPDATVNNDGVMTKEQAEELATLVMGGMNIYSNDGVGAPIRPAANAVGAVAGVTAIQIWNITEKQPQYSDGVYWYNASGNITGS